MSQFDVVAVPASRDYSTFADLKLGRSSQTFVGRVLRHWDARNFKRQGEFMGVVFLLLDEQDSVIQGFIPASRASHYRQALREGTVVSIQAFEVARATTTFKLTEHQFFLRFLPTTTITQARNVVARIGRESFLLRTNEQLHSLANTNSELPDVVGQIRFVQGDNLTDPTSTARVVVRLRIDPEVVVYLTLWDDAAATFRAHLSSQNHKNAVMVVTIINPKIYGDSLYLNSTPATRFYFGDDCSAIQSFIERCGVEAAGTFAQAETSGTIKKFESVTLLELNMYISQSSDQAQDAEFSCKARILDVVRTNGWSYIACSRCSTKLEMNGTALRCNKCCNFNATALLRYRVELSIKDDLDSATFVVFDPVMTKLLAKTAATLTTEICKHNLLYPNLFTNDNIDYPRQQSAGLDEGKLPTSLEALEGQVFVFQVKVTAYNFTPKHRTFTVVKMTSEQPADGSEEDTGNDVPPPDSPPPPPRKDQGVKALMTLKNKSVADPDEGTMKKQKKHVDKDILALEIKSFFFLNPLMGVCFSPLYLL